jgi:cytochrome bd ubiquinol oxidase subunit I
MDTLSAARGQMELSLGFHMVLAASGIGMPLLMLMAEGMWLRTGQPHYRDLARKWAKASGLLFALGAVSGTALSFAFGLLWPRLMGFAGSIIGPAFALEGFAFFVEAIFLGLYLYGCPRTCRPFTPPCWARPG